MPLPMRAVFAVSMLGLAWLGTAEAQDAVTKRDSQGPVTVAVTPLGSVTVGAPLKIKIVLDTHSVGLDGVAFDKAVALRAPEGAEVAPQAVETKGSGHHREAVVTFPPPPGGPLRIVVKGVAGVAERLFTWD